MTYSVPVDDPEALRRVLSNTEALLLDFDGPICSVFSGIPAHYVAAQLRKVLTDSGHTDLPPEVEETDDPFGVFLYASGIGESVARHVEAALSAYEVEAVLISKPTPGANELIRDWDQSGRKLAIVSNNGVGAVESYLRLHNLKDHVSVISARHSHDTTLLKPSPHLVNQAVAQLGFHANDCTLIGDSTSDIVSAGLAGTSCIGFANRPEKISLMASSTASVVICKLFDRSYFDSLD